jgi:hypothetical protein
MSTAMQFTPVEDRLPESDVKPGGREIAINQDRAPTPGGDSAMVSMIERIVMDPSIPIERLERVLAMKERMEDRARQDRREVAERAYNAAMSACQAELPVVRRNRKNTHTNSTYADLAAIEDQAMPIIHRHGFSTSFQPAGYNEKGEQLIKWKIAHNDGHSESEIAEIPVDAAGAQGKVNKTGTQAFGSTSTYGRRYLLCMLFNISTGDDNDGNAVAGKETGSKTPILDAQVERLRKLIEETKSSEEKLCAYFKVESLADLYQSEFEQALKLLEAKKVRDE